MEGKRSGALVLAKGLGVICFLLVGCFIAESAQGRSAWFEAYGIRSKSELTQPSSIPGLIQALKDRDARTRKAAVKTLGRHATGEVAAALSGVLQDPHPKVRAEAVHALGAIGRKGVAVGPRLVPALSDKDANVRLSALRALVQVRYNGADLQAKVQEMAARDPHRKVKAEAQSALAKIDSTGAIANAGADAGTGRPSPDSSVDLPKTAQVNRYGVAVIIGNRHYAVAGKDVPDVDYAHNDADAMVRYVTGTLGFREGNVIVLKNASQADLIGTFGQKGNPKGKLYDWLRPNESDVFVYYSGHGAPSLTDGRGYLLPVDADPLKVELNGYPLDTLFANLGKLPARHVTVVLDACFSGVTAAGAVVKNASSISLRLVEPPASSTAGMDVLTASQPSQVASWDVQAGHGLLTSYFLQGVSSAADEEPFGNGDGRVTLSELKKYLEEEVAYYARRTYGRDQNPQIKGDSRTVLAELEEEEEE